MVDIMTHSTNLSLAVLGKFSGEMLSALKQKIGQGKKLKVQVAPPPPFHSVLFHFDVMKYQILKHKQLEDESIHRTTIYQSNECTALKQRNTAPLSFGCLLYVWTWCPWWLFFLFFFLVCHF